MLKAILKQALLAMMVLATRFECFAEGPLFEGKLVFFGNTVAGRQCIESTTLEATQLQTALEVPEGEYIVSGRIAPDARALAFTTTTGQSQPTTLWLWEAGSDRKKLADNVTAVRAWSPEGATIVGFHGDADGKFASFTIDLASGRREKIDLPDTDWVDDWSPNGRTLLATLGNPTLSYVRADGEEYPLRALVSLDVGGDRRTPITADPQGDFLWPRYSPDGRRIAFCARHHRGGKTAEYAVVAAADGSQARELVCFRSLEAEAVVKPHGAPCWSHDGKTILFKVTKRPRKQDAVGVDQIRYELVTLAADGTGVRRIPLGTDRSWWGFVDCR